MGQFSVEKPVAPGSALSGNQQTFDPELIQLALYRPFDVRWLYYDPKLTSRPAQTVMQHLKSRNLALLVTRQISTGDFRHVFITDKLCDRDPLSVATRERTQSLSLIPLR